MERYIRLDRETFGELTVHTRRLASEAELVEQASNVMAEQRHTFLINCQLGYILKDMATSAYELFYAGKAFAFCYEIVGLCIYICFRNKYKSI